MLISTGHRRTGVLAFHSYSEEKWGCTAGVVLTQYLYVLVLSFGPWSSSSFDRSYRSPA